MNFDDMTADEILALRVQDARHLFAADGEQVFKRLAKLWHPDVSKDPKAADVFRRIVFLRKATKSGEGMTLIVDDKGEDHVELFPIGNTDLGRRWAGPDIFAWSFEKEPDLARVFIRNLRRIPFADNKMREQMRQVFPKYMREVRHDDQPMLIFPRLQSAILADWIGVHGPLPAVHAAWVGSGLLNIAAYTTYSGWHLPAIGPDTIGLDPATHKVFLFAGWESACGPFERPAVASQRTLSLCPALSAPGRTCPDTLTLDVIRRTMRESLGDPSGLTLEENGVPRPMAKWINAPSLPDGRKDYSNWHRALEEAFGARRFVEWDRGVAEVYPNH